ncbi:MAG TPA: LLM class flavin-dependent oxidoreductase [Acidimicrobiales bacterium]|nr:LLM class flavin-dependent oxidoreductase [Acidimicrobiales bacterium]
MVIWSVGLRLRLAPLARGLPRAGIALAELGSVAVEAEAAGFDALYLAGSDQNIVLGTPDGAETVLPDPFVALGAVVPLTSRLALGCLATPLGERPPSLLAKVVASLDVCSAGRAVAALGPAPRGPGTAAPQGADAARAKPGRARTGGAERESDAIGRLGEALEVCRAMLRLPAPSMDGAYYRIDRAWNEPKADRPEPTPVGLLIPRGDDGPSDAQDGEVAALLGLAARFADVCFLGPGPALLDDLGSITEAFRAACRQAGRLPGSVALVSLLAAGDHVDVATLGALGARCRADGADGIVLDWRGGVPSGATLDGLASALRAT